MKKLTHSDIQHIHDSNSIAILAVDTGGLITYANPTVMTYLRSEVAQLLGKNLFHFFTDTSTEQTYQKALLAGEPITNKEFAVKAPLKNVGYCLVPI
ncbi:PAS domain-containing protein [Pedobacter steynii]